MGFLVFLFFFLCVVGVSRSAAGSRERPVALISACFLFFVAVAVSSSAQESTASPDELHERLDAARAEVEDIQREAETVADQVASIDKQVAAVESALDASTRLVERTQAEIAVLESEIRQEQREYDRVREQAVDIAVSLYKSGPSAQLEPFVSAQSLSDLTDSIEYSGNVAQTHAEVMVRTKRLEAELEVQTQDLEVKLAEALTLRREQERQAQHLKELRRAQSMKLADLREDVEAARREAAAIEARSAEIADSLAAAAPAAPLPVAASGSSGFAWPISGAITSGYGPRWGRMHSGVDIDCVTGAAIRASKAGTVVSASYDEGGYGYHVVIDHGGGLASLYAHASELYVTGGSVSQGETIAACGSTGASTGDHLHFEIRVNGSPQDPMGYLP